MESNQLVSKEIAAAIPENIRFGTSTWTYPGWKGLIYQKQYSSDKDFRANSLAEYSTHPMFRTVGIDSTFYGPPKVKTLKNYAAQVPESFKWISKVWERITIPQYAQHPRYGELAGKPNPDFLNQELFLEQVLEPYREAGVLNNTGPFVFQFQTINKGTLEPEAFFEKLSKFLTGLPTDYRYATEIRNPGYICPEYISILNSSGATHCFNHWNYMPSLLSQMKKIADAGGLKADFYTARILTPNRVGYREAVKMFEPYDQIKKPDPEMRKDVLRLVSRALKRSSEAFIIVNNRAEGNSPMTISAIIEMLTQALKNE